MPAVSLHGLEGLPLVQPGDDLPALLCDALDRAGLRLTDGDVLVVAQKIVSKAEGRRRPLAEVVPSPRALELAEVVRKDPRLVEVVLSESRDVIRAVPNVLIVEHRLGFVMANAGVDQSNVEGDEAAALLLPEDPDASCRRLRAALERRYGARLAVVMNDSFGRPWRNGVTGVCIGASGLPALLDRRGAPDLFGRALRITEIAVGDEVAAAASMVMGQAGEGIPAVLVRGLRIEGPDRPASALIRSRQHDLFR
ncbi:coenzyme F420-0:L-glutamate ligase [Azospirillum canadense]|uniref:coenzyme F420-0:L-glutamate ligase n=1 Tax=Azospirillum canadense TaxID=403962 RepID=UPI0022272623|nr:coenzyme F420-0:L-glutamate ligase [Azospirillum canadense]MCW2239398.1 coenzyme F420-0:L-glutamate ligase/coenzyme F420-1:gamma-L-glutamate ligase [Azospirillum canadense]